LQHKGSTVFLGWLKSGKIGSNWREHDLLEMFIKIISCCMLYPWATVGVTEFNNTKAIDSRQALFEVIAAEFLEVCKEEKIRSLEDILDVFFTKYNL
jgi:hypothetical protein